MKDITIETVLKIAGNVKPTINLNDPACLKTCFGFMSVIGISVSIIAGCKKKWGYMSASVATTLASMGACRYLILLDNKNTDKKYRHEERLKELMHPIRNVESDNSSNQPVTPIKKVFHCPKLPIMLPPILDDIIKGAPKGFEISFLMSILSMISALCFSRVRAKRDGKLQAPNLQVVVSGPSGQGKGKIMDVYNAFFSRIIERDIANFNCGKHIIQTSGINYSEPKLYEILNNMQELHMLVVEPEISAVTQILKKSSTGFGYDTLRNAFDGAEVNWSTKRQTFRGKLLLNFVFTGTDETVKQFLAGHVEDGTANRIIHATIPEQGRELPSIDYPKNMEYIKDYFDDCHSKYCYHVDANGNEFAVPIKLINLDYVNEALDKWVDLQYNKTDHQKMRRDRRARTATIAFHAGIVAHMLCNEPGEDEPLMRSLVVELALFVADYTMERYIYDFDDSSPAKYRHGTPAEWKKRHEKGDFWRQIDIDEGKRPGTTRKAVQRYKKKHK